MPSIQRAFCAAAAYAALLVVFALVSSPRAHSQGKGGGQPPGQEVTVINSAANPVPVNGNVNLNSAIQLAAGGKVGIDPNANTVGLAAGSRVGIDPNANTVRVATSPAAPVFIRSVNDA